MSGVNKVILVGRLGANPDSRYTPGGQSVANFNVATSENWTDKNGQRQERTEWHKVVVWGKLADLCKQYLSKGRQVYLEGKLQTRSWEDKEGQKRYTTEVVAQTIQFLGAGAGASAGQGGGERDVPSNFGEEPVAGMEFSNDAGGGSAEADIPF